MAFGRLLLVMLAIITVANAQKQNITCGKRHDFECVKQFHDKLFRRATKGLMWLENRLTGACLRQSNGRFREVIETGRYKLTTTLKGYSKRDFDIKIKGPVLYMTAKNERAFNVEVIVLPRFVEARRASFLYDGSSLDVVFPVASAAGTCDRGFRDLLRTVPKFELVWGPRNTSYN